MGLIAKHRKSYLSNKKRWDKNTIEEEKILVKDYAIRNKKEIKKIENLISKFKSVAKNLNRNSETKESLQAKNLIAKLKHKGFLAQDATSLDEILDIEIRNVLDRRLSNILYKLKLARTPKQARQFIVHRHIKIADKTIDSPSFLVSLVEETQIEFLENSALSNEEHPERKILIESVEEVIEKNKNLEEKTKDKSSLASEEKILEDKEQDEEQDEVKK